MERQYALFAETDPGVDNIHDSEKFPFLFISQYIKAKKLVLMPTESFHRLAGEIGEPKMPVGVVNMTARCGSTLLAQMANRISNTRSMSEPWATTNIDDLRGRGVISEQESKALLKSAFQVHCKVAPGEKLDFILVKLNVRNARQIPDLKDIFPQFHYFFNTRHPVPSALSLKQV